VVRSTYLSSFCRLLHQGDVKVQATLNDANGNRLACYQIIASLTAV
jgi:hypothetical protein